MESVVFVARFAFSVAAPEHQSHDSTRSQLSCTPLLQPRPLGSCTHMALFCLMTVCVEPSLEAGSPGGQAYRHTQIKSKQIKPKACMLSEA